MKIGLTGSIACGKAPSASISGKRVVSSSMWMRFPRADRRRRRGAARNPPGVRRRRVFWRVARPRKASASLVFADAQKRETLNAILHPDDPFGNQASARPPDAPGADRRRRYSAAVRVRNGIHVRYRLGRPRGAGNADSAPFSSATGSAASRPSAALIRKCRRMKRSAAQTPSLIPTVPSSRRADRWMRCWRPLFPARRFGADGRRSPLVFPTTLCRKGRLSRGAPSAP